MRTVCEVTDNTSMAAEKLYAAFGYVQWEAQNDLIKNYWRDGLQKFLNNVECRECFDSGSCDDCDGSGEVAGCYYADDGMQSCPTCNGSGKCSCQ